MKIKKEKGFTLIELLVVIGILAILFGVVLIAIDPSKRLKQARDSQRKQDVYSIEQAVQEYIVDNAGNYPFATSGVNYMLGTSLGNCSATCGNFSPVTSTAACLDLSNNSTLVPQYLASMPIDPLNGTTTVTQYVMSRNSAGRVTITSCQAELNAITVQR